MCCESLDWTRAAKHPRSSAGSGRLRTSNTLRSPAPLDRACFHQTADRSRSPRGRVRSTLARGRHPLARLSVVARSPKPHVESKETVTCFEAHSEAQSSSTAIDSSLMLRPSKSVRDKTKGRSRLVLLESHVREMTACNHALCWAWCLGGRWVCTATGRRNAFSCICRPRARVWAAASTRSCTAWRRRQP